MATEVPRPSDGYGPCGGEHELRPSAPAPITSLNLYRRCAFGRKHFYVPAGSDGPDADARYFISNPVPQKHAGQWKPLMHRGDNPKTYTGGRVVARARRTAFWSSFRIELGDGVDEVLANERRVRQRRSYERRQKLRRTFCMGEKPPKEPLEHEQDVAGFVLALAMRRRAFLNRTLRFEWAGQEYRWSGTRSFLPSWSKNLKGVSHDLKLIDSNGDLVATFKKDRWVSYKPSEKPGNPHNKKKSFVGTLSIWPAAKRATTVDVAAAQSNSTASQSKSKVDDIDHVVSGNRNKLEANVNLGGRHSGDLTEEVIAFTCWMAVEAEHRLRYKIFDLIEEVAENVGG